MVGIIVNGPEVHDGSSDPLEPNTQIGIAVLQVPTKHISSVVQSASSVQTGVGVGDGVPDGVGDGVLDGVGVGDASGLHTPVLLST